MLRSRKVIALILTLAMILPMFNVGVFAAGTDASGDTAAEEPKPVSSEPTYPKNEDGTFDDTAGWAYYAGQYVDKNDDVFSDNTLVITTAAALSSFYTALNTELKNADPDVGNTASKTVVKHVVVDFATPSAMNTWTYIVSMTNLETVTIRNATSVNGPTKALNIKSCYTIEDSGSINRHNNLAFTSDSGKVVVRNCTSITECGFTTGTKNFRFSKAIPGLKEVLLENVKTINQSAFAGNDQLTDVTVLYTDPTLNGVIKSYAFYRCTKLENVHFDLAGCGQLESNVFYVDTGSPDTNVTVDNFKKENTKVGEDPFYDQLNNNPFKEEELTDQQIIDIYKGDFELEQKDPLKLGPDSSYTSSKVGEDLLTQVTKSARWANGSDSTAEVALKFAFNKKPGHDYLIILDVSMSSGDTWGEYSKLNVYKSFIIEAARALLTTEGYDNRIGIIPFIDNKNTLDAQGFSSSYDEIEAWMLDMTVPKVADTSTQTRVAFEKAVEMVNGRTDKSREVEIILVTDGQVSIAEWYTDPVPKNFKEEDRQAFNESLAALHDLGVNIYGVAPLSGTATINLAYMNKVASDIPKEAIDESTVAGDFESYEGKLLYSARNPKGFGEAIKFVLDHIITEYVITDPVDPRFTVDANSIVASAGTEAKLSEDGKFITWTIYGLPYQEYTLNFTETLNDPENDPNSFGNVNTNYGYAQVDEVGGEAGVNRVESPVLPRPLPEYTITIHYLEEGTNVTVQEDTVEHRLRFESYEFDFSKAPKEIGDYFFTGPYSGTIEVDPVTGDYTITLYYQHKYEITVQPKGDKVEYNRTEQSVAGFETLTFEVDGATYTVEGLTAGASGRNVGVYNVSVNGTPVVIDANGSDVTYKFIVNIGTAELEITKKDVIFTSETLSKVYDGDPLRANGEVTVEGLVEGDNVTFVADDKSIVRPGTLTEGNSFKYFWEDTANANNYNVTVVYGDLVITNAAYEITVRPNGGEFVYDGTEKSVSGFETLTFIVNGKVYTVEGLTAGAARTNVGTTDVTVSGTAKVLDSDREDVTSSFTVHIGTATLTVTPRQVVVTANDKSKIYGDADPELTATVEGLVDGDTIDYDIERVPGEDVGEYMIVVSGSGIQGNYLVTYRSGTFTIDPRPVTVTANDKSKVYGEKDPTLDATVTGTINGDTVVYTVGRVPGEDVGEYDITPTGELRQGNYIVSYVMGTLTITPKTVVVTPNDTEKTYGDADPELTATVDGLVGSDKIDYTLDREDGENIGEYEITAEGATEQGNYIVVYETGTFTINPRPVTVTANDKSKTYGDADPELDAVVEGLVGDDTVDYDIARVPGEDVGRYTITPSGETEQGNYTVTYVTGTLTIEPREVTVTANDKSKVYGDADPELDAEVEGLLDGDTVDYDIERVPGEDVGEYTITPSGETEQGNYTVTYVTGTLTITPKEVVVTPHDATKVYGDEDPELTATVSGLLGDDTIDYNVSRQAGENVGEYGIVAFGETEQGNYTVVYETATFTITPRPVTVTANDKSKVYGDEDPELDAVVEGLVGDDTVDYDIARVPGEDVGDYTITPSGETEQGNYTVTYVTGTLSIRPLSVTVTANDKSKVYGDADPELDAVVEGLINGDTIEYDIERVPGENVGEYTITPSGAAAQGNYVVTYVTGTLTITPKEVVVTPHDATKVYGDEDPELTATVSGLLGDDTVEYNVSRQAGENVGEYGITSFGETEQVNYIVVYETATFTITPRTVVVTPHDDGKVYGDEDPELTATVEGLVWNDEIEYTVTREAGENVGEYVITAEGETEQGNYIVVYETATFTITPRTVTVTADSFTKTAGEEDPEFTANVEGLIGDDTVDYDITREPGEEPGEYDIIPSGEPEQGNYIVEYVNGTLTITERPTYTVTVNYVDTDGETIRESVTVTYEEGDAYEVTVPEIEGYEFSYAEGETEGTVTGDIEITLVYAENVDIPDEPTPGTDAPVTEPPIEDIPDEPVPGTDAPDTEPPIEDIPDEDIPMTEVPKTGDENTISIWITLMIVFAAGAGTVIVWTNRRKENEDDAE